MYTICIYVNVIHFAKLYSYGSILINTLNLHKLFVVFLLIVVKGLLNLYKLKVSSGRFYTYETIVPMGSNRSSEVFVDINSSTKHFTLGQRKKRHLNHVRLVTGIAPS